jgi:dolichol-phosphate mannosyltransferase
VSSVGVVIPTYKEADNIARLIRDVRDAVPGIMVIVVDDSPDESTMAAVAPLRGRDVTAVHRPGKGGRGSAVLAGMRQLLLEGAGTIVEMDADHSHRPSELPALLARARERELDLLIASRYLADSRIEDWPLTRRLFSGAANRLARRVLGVPVRDYTNGYRVYSRRAAELVVERCGRAGTGFIALSEILVTLHYSGMRVGEVPSVFVNRARGESSVTAREIASAWIGLWKTFKLRRRLERDAS